MAGLLTIKVQPRSSHGRVANARLSCARAPIKPFEIQKPVSLQF